MNQETLSLTPENFPVGSMGQSVMQKKWFRILEWNTEDLDRPLCTMYAWPSENEAEFRANDTATATILQNVNTAKVTAWRIDEDIQEDADDEGDIFSALGEVEEPAPPVEEPERTIEEPVSEPIVAEPKPVPAKEEEAHSRTYFKDIEVPTRLRNVMAMAGFNTVEETLEMSVTELMALRGAGARTIGQLIELQEKYCGRTSPEMPLRQADISEDSPPAIQTPETVNPIVIETPPAVTPTAPGHVVKPAATSLDKVIDKVVGAFDVLLSQDVWDDQMQKKAVHLATVLGSLIELKRLRTQNG